MRRSRALVVFGGFWVGMAVATVTVHSQAAGPYSDSGGQSGWAEMDPAPILSTNSQSLGFGRILTDLSSCSPGLDHEPAEPGALGRDFDDSAERAAAVLSPAPDHGPEEPSWIHRQILPSLLAKHDTQAVFGSFIRPGASPSALPSDDACPPDMVGIEGDYCPLVAQNCLRWLDPSTRLQCAEFERSATARTCSMNVQHKRFCIDRYEWPNKVGALPRYMASWSEAKASCETIGKRLCSDTEWTLACEGPERQPYPYGDGYVRDDGACNIDKPYIWPHPEKIFDPKVQDQELARLDQREPSGSRAACVSPYGVRDMVGNVDEWVYNESQFGKPYRSGLKGGYWGPVRTRCRPMTTAHDETFRYYQIGFRCCGQAHAVDVGDLPMAER